MKRKTAAILWPMIALVAFFLVGFVLAYSMRPDPPTVEVVTRSGPSAAATLSLVLFGVLGTFVVMAVGCVILAVVIRARQQTQRMEQAALLFGARQPQPTPQRRPRVGTGDNAPSVVIVAGQGDGPRMEVRDGYR